MCALRGNVTRLVLMACLTVLLAGCPLKGDNGLTLIITPGSLNFGSDEDSLSIQIHRNLTNAPVEPVVVSSSQSWIVPETCTSLSDNCVGFGFVDRLFVPIRIDRTKMLLGTNHGQVFVQTSGAGIQKIDVYAEDVLYVDFRVNNRAPAVGQAVSFEDASEKTEDAGDVLSRLWDFGDGTTSTATDPSHVYTTPGLYSVSLTVTTANGEETARKAAWITVGTPPPATNFEASSLSIFEGDTIVFTDLSTSTNEPITSRLWKFGDGRSSTSARPEHQYTKAGVYTVSLTITTANTNRTETKANYIVVQRKVAPVANFTVNPSSPVALREAFFSDNSEDGSAPVTQWFWEFGDGVTSRQENPSHVFAEGGEYLVTLSVGSAHGSHSVSKTVTVRTVPPTAAFTASDTTPFVLETVTFTNNSTEGSAPITQYLWEFGDGGSSTQKNPTHVYNGAGVFNVRLTAVSSHGSGTTTTPITVSYKAPTANFTVDTQTPSVGDSVQFTDLSTAGTAAVNSWLWDFGDPASGANNISVAQDPSHTYNAAGFYTVTLTVSTPVASNNSNTMVKTAFINVVQGPTGSFTFEAVNPTQPDVVQFTDTSVMGSEPIVSRFWDFGDSGSDSNTSVLRNPTHTFSSEGIFTVTLTVQSANRSDTVSNMVTIEFVPPTVDFTVETVADTPREAVLTDGALTTDTLQFNSLITLGTDNDIANFSFAWDFGDGNTSNLQEPTHSYDTGGTYTVTYTVTTATESATVSHDISVDEPPIPEFSAQPQIAPTNTSIQFNDLSDDSGSEPIQSRFWNFGDNGVSVLLNPTHTYAAVGDYTVSLTLNFNHGLTGVPMSVTLTKTDFVRITQ